MFDHLITNRNRRISSGRGNLSITEQTGGLGYAEVVDIILSEDHPEFNNYTDIGRIRFRFVAGGGVLDENLSWASPFGMGIKVFPLKHEVVAISSRLGDTGEATRYYYSSPVNLWGSANVNLFPGIGANGISDSVGGEYEDAQLGNPVGSDTAIIDVGDSFEPNLSIRPLQPSEGDVVIEGRAGNSIRMGHNPDTGNSLVYIRSGQRSDISDDTSQPVVEDINKDDSSMWLTSDIQVPVELAGVERTAMVGTEVLPNEFSGKQIVISSGRIIFNSRDSQLIGCSATGIGFSTDGKFSLDSADEFVVNAPTMRIGWGATQQAVLGNQLVELIEELLDAIPKLKYHYSELTGAIALQPIRAKLQRILSNRVYTV